MIDKSHIKMFNDIKTYIPSQKEIKNLKATLIDFIPIIRSIGACSTVTNVNGLKSSILDFANNLFNEYYETGYIDSRLYEHQAIEYLLKNPKIIKKKYPDLLGKPNTHTVYTADLNKSLRLALINALDEISACEDFAAKNNIKANTSFNISKADINKQEKIKTILKFITKLLNAPSKEDQITIMLKAEQKKNEDFTRSHLIESISLFYDFFNTFGFSDKYLNSYNYNSQKFDFPELSYAKSSGKFSKDSIGFEELFSKQFLEALDIKSLCFLNAFWSNRFAKECAKLNLAACAIDSLNLWKDILNDKKDYYFSDEALTAIIKKNHYISQLLEQSFNLCQRNITQQEIKEGVNFSAPLEKDVTPYFKQLENYIGKDYEMFFSEHLDGDNHFLSDVAYASQFSNLEMFTYQKKNTTIEALIKYALDNPHFIKNWGIIRDEIYDGTYIDSIDAKKPKILFAFDIEGFNFPFRFHLKTSALESLLKYSTNGSLVPEYQGNDDFIANDEFIPANIIMPIQKKHKNSIIANSTNVSRNTNLWEHLYFLMNGRFPEHLTKSNKYYTDMHTGKRFKYQKKAFNEIDIDDGR